MYRALIVVGSALLLPALACSPGTSTTSPAIGGSGGAAGEGGSGSTGGSAGGGSGGTAAGGAGGVAGSGGSGGVAKWYDDPDLWTPIPGGEFLDDTCVHSQADPASIHRKLLGWESCGPHCEQTSLDLGGFHYPGGKLPRASTAVVDGVASAYISVLYGERRGNRGVGLFHVIRLDDGELVASLKREQDLDADCGFGNADNTAFAPYAYGPPDGDNSRNVFGVLNPTTERWTWFPPWTDEYLCDRFPLHDARGDRLLSACGAVGGFLTPGSNEIGIIADGEDAIGGSGRSEGGLAVWAESLAPTTARIRGWSIDGGLRTLIPELSGRTCRVGLSRDRMVGVHFPQGGYCNTYNPEVRLWQSPRAERAEDVHLTMGPPLAAFDLGVYWMTSWGNFVALAVSDLPTRDEFVIVVRLSDWTVRRIVPQPMRIVPPDTVALTDRYIYWGESNSITLVSEMYRFDLEHFEQLGEPFVSTLPPAE